MFIEPIKVESNVRLRAYVGDKLVDERESHNILTNIGRNWLRDLVGFTDFTGLAGGAFASPDTRTDERATYIAFGVGGVLSADPTIYNATQEELVTVSALEDYVKIDATPTYMKAVEDQTNGSDSIVGSYAIRFISTILESEISFAANVSKSGGLAVGTNVPISEVGLYLSGANPAVDLDNATNNARLVAYNLFDSITVTPNIVLRIEWELRF
jgi:hypothetical protein